MSGVWRPCSRRTNERKWLSEADWQQCFRARAQLRDVLSCHVNPRIFADWNEWFCAVSDKRLQTTEISSVLFVKLYSSAHLLGIYSFHKVLHGVRVPSWWNLVDVWHLLPSCIITTDTGNRDKLVELEGFLFIVLDLLKSSVVVCMFFVYIYSVDSRLAFLILSDL